MVLTTAPDEKAASRIASEMVEKRFAACAQVLPGINSYYWWKGKLENAMERLIIFKTSSEKLETLTAGIEEIHPYDVPEIVAFEVKGGAEKYLQWVVKETRR